MTRKYNLIICNLNVLKRSLDEKYLIKNQIFIQMFNICTT